MAEEIEVVTFQDIFQYEAQKKGRYSEEFRKASALVFLDQGDMGKLGIKDGERVKMENDAGSVVVAAKASVDFAHPGLAFMVSSPWANQLAADQVCQAGVSDFKRIKASISATGDDQTEMEDLVQRMKA
ncbi:MAG: formylmethanofuran dehydrogenase [Methanotrichaceae archaeon]|nr:formylmethanofuran dehydrogenase [Methanotrichaceae archaeon]